MHIKVSDLAPALRYALESINYHRKDISVEGNTKASVFVGGMAGFKGFAILVNMDNQTYQTHWGSWGGANMFNPKNAVDLDTSYYNLPPNGAVITGEKGSTTYAAITVHPDLLPKMLPAKTIELPQESKDALYCFRSIKGGDYRREELRRRKVSQATIDHLVLIGYLKRSANGATQITTEGKNAVEGYHGL